jgi:hypothetical protein
MMTLDHFHRDALPIAGPRQEATPRSIRSTIISPHDALAIPAHPFARAIACAVRRLEEMDVDEILFRPTRPGLYTPPAQYRSRARAPCELAFLVRD